MSHLDGTVNNARTSIPIKVFCFLPHPPPSLWYGIITLHLYSETNQIVVSSIEHVLIRQHCNVCSSY